jgi:hypothetical protein
MELAARMFQLEKKSIFLFRELKLHVLKAGNCNVFISLSRY